MYRVELKGKVADGKIVIQGIVPNVPCGVERQFPGLLVALSLFVPNVPCGVESALAPQRSYLL